MAKPKLDANPAHAKALAQYERVVANVPGLELKGVAKPYTSVNGNMTSYLHPRGEVALRLPPQTRMSFLESHETTLFEAYGIVQKEYVTVPATLLADTPALTPYFLESLAYVSNLKAKPTSRKT